MTPADYKALVQQAIDQGLMAPTKPLYDEYGYRIAQPATLPRDHYYTSAQAAAVLGVRATSVDRHFKDKDLTPYTTNNNNIRLWLRSDVEAIMAARRPAGRPDDPDYITITEAAEILNVSPKTVSARARKHNIETLVRLIDHHNRCKVATAFIRKSQLKLITK